jgi:hypothetical protein
MDNAAGRCGVCGRDPSEPGPAAVADPSLPRMRRVGATRRDRLAVGLMFAVFCLACASIIPVIVLVTTEGFPWWGVALMVTLGLTGYGLIGFFLLIPAIQEVRHSAQANRPQPALLSPGQEPRVPELRHRGSIEWRLGLFLPAVVVSLVWGSVGAAMLRRHQELSHVVAELGDQLGPEGPAEVLPPARLSQVIVWDVEAGIERTATRNRLPATMGLRTLTEPVTVVAILRVTREKRGHYSNRRDAVRQSAQVRLIEWPGGRTRGTHAVVGADPPEYLSRHENGWGPVLGDLDGPLAEWIKKLPPAADPR